MGDGEPWQGTLTYAAGGGGGGVQDMSHTTVNNSKMFRFRPILPKPTPEAAGSTGFAAGIQNVIVSKGRTKRKYVRVRRRNSGYTRKNSRFSQKSDTQDGAVVTLQLMPEKDEPAQPSLVAASWCSKNVDFEETEVEKIEIRNNQEPPSATATAEAGKVLDQAAGAVVVVESWVTVESVTDTCMDGGGLGCTDGEKVKNLEADTCPGFVSDGFWKVRWVNEAYKRMVMNKDSSDREQPSPEVLVWLKMKDDNALWCYSYPAFTCGVRLHYTWQNEKCTKMVPCDVWRMDCGGFAWRLDVKAALSLGL